VEEICNPTQEMMMANTMVAGHLSPATTKKNSAAWRHAPQFTNRYLRELKQQQTKADQFHPQLKTLLTEQQRSLTKRFFRHSGGYEVIGLHQRMRLTRRTQGQWMR
jgi:hypothetical protein